MASNTKRLMEVITELEAIKEKELEEATRKELEAQQKISKHDRLKQRHENR